MEQKFSRPLQDPLLNTPQFTADDTRLISGLSAGQLKGLIDRDQITLQSKHNPGTGKRRMFTGLDIVALTAVKAASDAGMPLRWAEALAIIVHGMATRMRSEGLEGIKSPSMRLAFFPNATGDEWGFQPFGDAPSHANLPASYHVLNVTFVVRHVLGRLCDIIDGVEEISAVDLGPPEVPDPSRE